MSAYADHVVVGRRDRHGRGMRGPLGPAHIPLVRTRMATFGAWMIEAVDFVEDRLTELDLVTPTAGLVDRFNAVDIVVDDVPLIEELPSTLDPPDDPPQIPLGRIEAAKGGEPARLIVHRRTVEQRSDDKVVRAQLVREVVVRLAAELLDIEPDSLDPEYDATL